MNKLLIRFIFSKQAFRLQGMCALVFSVGAAWFAVSQYNKTQAYLGDAQRVVAEVVEIQKERVKPKPRGGETLAEHSVYRYVLEWRDADGQTHTHVQGSGWNADLFDPEYSVGDQMDMLYHADASPTVRPYSFFSVWSAVFWSVFASVVAVLVAFVYFSIAGWLPSLFES